MKKKKAQLMMIISWADLFKGLIFGFIIGVVLCYLSAKGIIGFQICG